MNFRKIILTVALAALGSTVFAKPVDPSTALRVAARYLPPANLTVATIGDNLYLVRPADGAGFVLVSADDCARPVLAYSLNGQWPEAGDQMPAHVAAWIDGYGTTIAAMRSEGVVASPIVEALWCDDAPKGPDVGAIEPLLTTTWSQSPRYNNMCPTDNRGRHAVTGCVATATAQIMKYWNHPVRGRGSHSYGCGSFGTLSADFDTVYPWSSMPNALGYASSNGQINAVALLMYHVGVAVEMNYGVNASGAQILESYGASSEQALKSYFRYNPMLHGLLHDAYAEREWDSIMLVEMSHRRPVLYTGFGSDAGHAFVIDGCNTNHATNGNRYFHVNWGWGGAYDGYFTFDALCPTGGGTGSSSSNSYNSNCQALIGIQPSYNSLGDSLALVAVVSADTTRGTVSGTGVYNVGTDRITVLATAAPGYRFDHWASGNVLNPIECNADGDIVDTAYFTPVGRDTIAYCANTYSNGVRSSDTTRWAIRIPAERRNQQRSVSSVQVYIFGSGYYTIDIHQGTTPSRDNRLYSMRSYYMAHNWYTIELDSAVAVDDSRPVWVAMRNNGTEHVLAAASSHYCGVSDGSWFYRNGRWQPYDAIGGWYTWMIKARFTPREAGQSAVSVAAKYFVDTVEIELPAECSVSGGGLFNEGATGTISATTGGGMHFWYWLSSYGDTIADNPYTFTAGCNPATYTAVFAPYDVSIDDVTAAPMRVRVIGRQVSVDLPAGSDVRAYDIQGRPVAKGTRFTLPAAGVYLLRAGAQTHKIVVL